LTFFLRHKFFIFPYFFFSIITKQKKKKKRKEFGSGARGQHTTRTHERYGWWLLSFFFLNLSLSLCVCFWVLDERGERELIFINFFHSPAKERKEEVAFSLDSFIHSSREREREMDFASVGDRISTLTKKAKTEAERLFLPSASSLGIPVSSAEDVIMAESEFARLCAQSHAAADAEKYKKELDDARFRLVWALSHSRREEHLRHAENILLDETLDWDDVLTHRDRYYLKAVLYYNRCDYLSCRDNAFTCLSVDPTCVQAQNLRQACEEYLARDGIIGITGVVAGVAVLGAMFASRR